MFTILHYGMFRKIQQSLTSQIFSEFHSGVFQENSWVENVSSQVLKWLRSGICPIMSLVVGLFSVLAKNPVKKQKNEQT